MTGRVREFRYKISLLIFGVLFVALPLCLFTGPAVYHLATGTTMPMKLSKYSQTTRPSTTNELWMLALFPLIHASVGAYLVLTWKNVRIRVDDAGLVGTNAFGKQTFAAPWGSLTSLERRSTRGGWTYTVRAEGQKLGFSSSLSNGDELLRQIQQRQPGLGIKRRWI